MNKMQKWIIGAAAAIFATWALFVLTPAVAHADTNDVDFIGVLAEQGIYPMPTVDALVTGGHQVCSLRSQGVPEMSVVDNVYRTTNLSAYQSGFFVGAAETVYCPDFYLGGDRGMRV